MEPGGTLLAGRYEMRHVLGAGPAGKVWSAYDFDTGVQVAVKIFHTHVRADPEFRKRVVRGAHDAARVEHPNLVAALGGSHSGLFVVMDQVRGDTMRALLDEHGPPSAEVAAELIYDACAALNAAHERGVLHGNLKPENLLVVSGYTRVTDLAVPAAPDSAGMPSLTSAHYQAPEVARTGSADARADLYALGCCLYELVVGRPPFHGPTAHDVAARHAAQPLALPSTLGIGVPSALEDVIQRALAKNPDERYQTALQMREALRQVALSLGDEEPESIPFEQVPFKPVPPEPEYALASAPEPARPVRRERPAPAPAREFTPEPDGPFAPAPSAPLRAPVSPLALMEADVASRPAPRPVAAEAAQPAADAAVPSRRARTARREPASRGIRILTAIIVFGLLTGLMTGTVAATGTARALFALVSPTSAASAASAPESEPSAEPAPEPEPAPEGTAGEAGESEPAPAPQPEDPPVADSPATVADLIAMIDADPAAVGPRGAEFRDRLAALPAKDGEALRLELSYLRSIATVGPVNGDFTPAFAEAAVRVLDQEIAALDQPPTTYQPPTT